MIGYLVVMSPNSVEPVKCGPELPVVETDQPAVVHLLKPTCPRKLSASASNGARSDHVSLGFSISLGYAFPSSRKTCHESPA